MISSYHFVLSHHGTGRGAYTAHGNCNGVPIVLSFGSRCFDITLLIPITVFIHQTLSFRYLVDSINYRGQFNPNSVTFCDSTTLDFSGTLDSRMGTSRMGTSSHYVVVTILASCLYAFARGAHISRGGAIRMHCVWGAQCGA